MVDPEDSFNETASCRGEMHIYAVTGRLMHLLFLFAIHVSISFTSHEIFLPTQEVRVYLFQPNRTNRRQDSQLEHMETGPKARLRRSVEKLKD